MSKFLKSYLFKSLVVAAVLSAMIVIVIFSVASHNHTVCQAAEQSRRDLTQYLWQQAQRVGAKGTAGYKYYSTHPVDKAQAKQIYLEFANGLKAIKGC